MAIYIHEEAANIVELFEETLEEHDVTLPSPEDDERDEEENPVRLYGSTFYKLLDSVETVLIDILNRKKAGEEIVLPDKN